jgi:hypothetical protein
MKQERWKFAVWPCSIIEAARKRPINPKNLSLFDGIQRSYPSSE